MAFGLGKYINRNVMDGFAGVSRGTEQWTVRASRRLTPELERSEVGPDRLRHRRAAASAPATGSRPTTSCRSASTSRSRGWSPPAMEERETHISRSRSRIDADIMRFHQSGVARGWVEVDGERTEIDDQRLGRRPRSLVGRALRGRPAGRRHRADARCPPDTSGMFVWMPVTMTRPDGRPFTLFVYYQRYQGAGWSTGSARGGIELPDGRTKPFRDVIPELEFRDDNRRLVGGTIRVVLADGTERAYRVEPVSTTGFHLGAGLYGGLRGSLPGRVARRAPRRRRARRGLRHRRGGAPPPSAPRLHRAGRRPRRRLDRHRDPAVQRRRRPPRHGPHRRGVLRVTDTVGRAAPRRRSSPPLDPPAFFPGAFDADPLRA